MKNIFTSKRNIAGLLLILFISLSFIIVSCSDYLNDPTIEDSSTVQDVSVLSKDNPVISAAIKVQEKHTAELMSMPDVVGTAVGLTEDGRPCILVLTKTDVKANALAKGQANPLPEVLENLPVEIMVTGEIVAFGGKPPGGGTGISYTAKQTPPIQLGTSGGWGYDLANGYCCGGTLGSLISSGGKQYILSNYHVLEADIVAGGNNRVAQTGDPVIQPGLIDISCNINNSQNVATLVKRSSLPGSNVDAAIAEVIPNMVRTDGAILGIGTLSSNTVAAAINQAVKKSGRTTGLTRSKISGLNATISVSYENECAGGAAFTKTFTGQIVISNKASKFLAGGDSGSLMVEDVTTNPRAIGLLFAGSSSSAIANPINQVLSFFGATMVGN
ncbi:MAG: hypothetical protein R6W90_12690 [Ignavibacteriaceae bacterium]